MGLFTCPHCGKLDIPTRKGLRLHIKNKPSCRRASKATKAAQRVETSATTSTQEVAILQSDPSSPMETDDQPPSMDSNDDTHLPRHFVDPPRDTRSAQELEAADTEVPTVNNPPSRRVTVEEVPDEDLDAGGLPHRPWMIEDYPEPAGTPLGTAETLFEEYRRVHKEAGKGKWAPFESEEEWELAQWLVTSGLSQQAIDKYLKLNIVSPFVNDA